MNKNKKKIITFGEIMLRISPSLYGERLLNASNFIIEPGGSESNVAVALSHLGQHCSFVTKIPYGVLSEKVISYLKSHSVDISNIVFGGYKIGTYWIEIGIGLRSYQVIYDRSYSAFSEISYSDFNWGEIFKGVYWFHTSGICPAVSQKTYNTLKKVIKNNKDNFIISIDLNYRSKLWRWVNGEKRSIHKIMWEICSGATLLAGNETDFSDSLGLKTRDVSNVSSYYHVARECYKKLKRLKYIAISLRTPISASENEWSGLLFVKKGNGFNCYRGIKLNIKNIFDRIGTGDSFVAGIIYGIINYKNDFQKIVNFAVALSTLKHTTRGDVSQFTNIEVENLLSNSKIKIVR